MVKRFKFALIALLILLPFFARSADNLIEPGKEIKDETIRTDKDYNHYVLKIKEDYDDKQDVWIRVTPSQSHLDANPDIFISKTFENVTNENYDIK